VSSLLTILSLKDDAMRSFHLLQIAMVWYSIVGLPVYSATTGGLNASIIETNLDCILNASGKFDGREQIERIVSFGDQSVPILTNRLAELRQRTNYRSCIVRCLCAIKTDASLRPVRDLLEDSSLDHQLLTAQQAAWESEISLMCQDLVTAIHLYPTNREEEVLVALIRLSNPAFGKMVGYYASERLGQMIRRKPSFAGVIVASLDDREDHEWFSYHLGDILAQESGHAFRWGIFGPHQGTDRVAQRNSIWRDWWRRNKDKSIAEWLEDAQRVSATIPVAYTATNNVGKH
jgi:hypothetical protein